MLDSNNRVVKVKSWGEFKQLVLEHDPPSIVYNIERGIPANQLKGLRLILPAKGAQYVFIDTAAGDRLRKTGIPLHKDRSGNIHIEDEDIANFVRTELNRKNLALHSYWTI